MLTETQLDHLSNLANDDPVFMASIEPQTREDLWWYIHDEFGISIPRVAVCADHCAPFDAFADAFFGYCDDMIQIGPRTGGKTLQFAILDVMLMKFKGTEIVNIGAIQEQADKCFGYVKSFELRPQFEGDLDGEPLATRTKLKNGANLKVIPATPRQVNSPHPNRAHWDEIEQTSWEVIQEGISMPVRQDNRPPAVIFTSSRKYAFGPMEKLIDEHVERGLTIYKWCWLEVSETCPTERHQEGVGCRVCPLEDKCREKELDAFGNETYVDGPGRAARSQGWMRIDDIIKKYKQLDDRTFDSQWGSKKPGAEGLAYPDFDAEIHVVDYEWKPAYPVVAGIDFGFVNPSVAIYCQPLENDDVVIFAEDYLSGRTADQLAASIKKEPWFGSTIWRVSDSADPGDAQTLRNYGVANEPCQKTGTKEEPSSVVAGINLVRFLMKPPKPRRRPIVFVARRCVNLIREIKHYHHPDATDIRPANERPVSKDDHACDAMRYMFQRLYRGRLSVG